MTQLAERLRELVDTRNQYGCVVHLDPSECRAVLALLDAAKLTDEHLTELEDAWRRGSLSESDGRGGERSNRNIKLERQLSKCIAALENPA